MPGWRLAKGQRLAKGSSRSRRRGSPARSPSLEASTVEQCNLPPVVSRLRETAAPDSQRRRHRWRPVPESIGEMIAHNVAAIAELTQRIKALDASKSGVLSASGERATLEPSWAYARGGTKAERLTRNYAFPNAETAICDVCWWAPRSISWDPSGPTARCASTDCVSPRRERPRPRSGPSSPSHESSQY
jgi:hypothetical protein